MPSAIWIERQHMIAILILAAGRSSRMRGEDKLLQKIDGTPQLTRITQVALATGAEVYVSLGPDDKKRADVLPTKTQIISVHNAKDGMGASIAAGVSRLPEDIQAVMITPADMPELTQDDLMKMLVKSQDHPTAILRATGAGKTGHPVVFPRACFSKLVQLTGDIGARSVVAESGLEVVSVPLPDVHALTDLDTPEDWENWRNRRSDDS